MVSFWPWKGDDSSPASFERALSSLSGKISKKTASLDSLRQTSRRYKALWTLYTSFAYILSFIVLFLVEGWRNWGPMQYTAVAGGPVVIYLVRLLLDTFYNYRISKISGQLEQLHKERETTIDRLKTATKYNSTQQLLEKYGGPSQQGSPSGPQRRKSGPAKDNSAGPKKGQKRTNFMPPPTANIPGRNPPPPISSPTSTPQPTRNTPNQQSPPSFPNSPPSARSQQPGISPPGSPEFAPNAYVAPPQYSSASDLVQSHWYDRVLDLLLGEDETLPKHRYALICKECRLVNGQAPPGTKSLADIGKWRCAGCGGWNGEQTETTKILQEMKAEQAKVQRGDGPSGLEAETISEGEGEAEKKLEQRVPPITADEESDSVSDGKEPLTELDEGQSDDDREADEHEAEPEPRKTRSKASSGEKSSRDGGKKKKTEG